MSATKTIRWRPGVAIAILGVIVFAAMRLLDVWPYEQARTLAQLATVLGTVALLLVWWLFFSRAPWRQRLAPLAVCALFPLLFRHRGMTGDFVPLFEFRFAKSGVSEVLGGKSTMARRADFPQLFGPNRDSRLAGPALDPDWKNHPPQILWRVPVGAAWSGFAIVGDRALTLEQQGEEELVTCRHISTGKLMWSTANAGHYHASIAGEGPRTTPTVQGTRVFTLGAMGTLRCLELESGKPVWTREVTKDAGIQISPTVTSENKGADDHAGAEASGTFPMWGFASSPLLHGGKVIVSAGGKDGNSLLAYDAATGAPAWHGGNRPINYSSPFFCTLAGRPQIVMFNTDAITAHDPATGEVLWEHKWGKGMPHVARPIPVGANRLFLSSGYGVGGALIEIAPGADGRLAASEVWRSIKFQAKFSNPVERGGFVYGVSDGIFACLDLADGKVRWKDGRYGHGQGLLIGEHYLQMTEIPGEIVLLRPTPEAANELARFRVFDEKTWNPIALSGDLLLVRNDREAACIRLPLAKPSP
ncbi:MAG: PQQ-binding-like beta-propeller repeat protein [Chthoniobacteraceae bacterium]